MACTAQAKNIFANIWRYLLHYTICHSWNLVSVGPYHSAVSHVLYYRKHESSLKIARPLPPVVDELAGKVAGIEERQPGIVDVVRVAHGQTPEEVADEDQTVGNRQGDKELSGGVPAERGRRDEDADGEEVADDADGNEEEGQRVEVDVKTDAHYPHRRQLVVVKDAARVGCCCCCSRQQQPIVDAFRCSLM